MGTVLTKGDYLLIGSFSGFVVGFLFCFACLWWASRGE